MIKGETVRAIDPVLRWAGGKQQLIPKLVLCLPGDIESRRYLEPFLGGGSLFFALQPQRAVLSDANKHLIDCYIQLRNAPRLVYKYLKKLVREHSPESYYSVRRDYNRLDYSAMQAARFIYLNKTCFNGIFRVNQKGEFNVPYGRNPNVTNITQDYFLRIAQALSNAILSSRSYDDILAKIGTNDFVYLDPPYPPLNGTSYFTHYTAERFNKNDQDKLANFCKEINATGCKLMLTNADTPQIRKLYRKFSLRSLRVTRYVTCKKHKHKVSELIITNY